MENVKFRMIFALSVSLALHGVFFLLVPLNTEEEYSTAQDVSIKVSLSRTEGEKTSVPEEQAGSVEPDLLELFEPLSKELTEKSETALEMVDVITDKSELPEPIDRLPGSPIEFSDTLNSSPVSPASVNSAEYTFEEGEVPVLPELLSDLDVKYPLKAVKKNYEGRTVFEVTVDSQGRAISAYMTESSGYDILDDSAYKAVLSARYKPGTPGASLIVSVVFQLK